MKKNLKTYTISFLALVALTIMIQPRFGAWVTPVLEQWGICTSKKNSLSGLTKDFFSTYLKKREDEVWQELEKLGITKQKLKDARSQYYQDYVKADMPPSKKKVDEEVKRLILDVFQEFDADHKKIQIISHPILAPIATTDKIILVNEEILKKLSEKAQRFVIAHEIQHIINQDSSTDYLVDKLLPQEQQVEGFAHPAHQFSCFREERADIQTALKSPQWAEYYLTFTQEIMDMWGDTDDQSHPKNSERLELAQNIVNHMKQETIA